MGLEFEFAKDPGSGNEVVVTARLCRTLDDNLVPENHPAARWLYCVPGDLIPRAEAEKYGLLSASEDEEPATDLKAIRAWAVENGIKVSKQGKIAQAVIDQYAKAHEADGED